VASCERAASAFDGLDPLLEMGFTGRPLDRLLEQIAACASYAAELRLASDGIHRALHAAEAELGVGALFWQLVSCDIETVGVPCAPPTALDGR